MGNAILAQPNAIALNEDAEPSMQKSVIGEGPLNPKIVASSIAKLDKSRIDERVIKARERLGREIRRKPSLVNNLIEFYEKTDFNPMRFERSRQEFYASRLLGALTRMRNEQLLMAEKLENQASELVVLCGGRTRIHTTNIQGVYDVIYMKALEKSLEKKGVPTLTMISSATPTIRSDSLNLNITVFGFMAGLPLPSVQNEDGEEISRWKDIRHRSMLALPAPRPEAVRSEVTEKIREVQRTRLSGSGVSMDNRLNSRLRDNSAVVLASLPFAAERSRSYDDFLRMYEFLIFSRIPGVLISDYLELTRVTRESVLSMLQDSRFRSTLRESFFGQAQKVTKSVSVGVARDYAGNYWPDKEREVITETEKKLLQEKELAETEELGEKIPFSIMLDSRGNYAEGPMYLTKDGGLFDTVDISDENPEPLLDRVEYLFPKNGLALTMLDLLLSPTYCTPMWSYVPATFYTSKRLFELMEYKQEVIPRVAMPRFMVKSISPRRSKRRMGATRTKTVNGLTIILEGPSPEKIEENILRIVPGQRRMLIPSRLHQNFTMNASAGLKPLLERNKRREREENVILEAVRNTLRKTRFGPDDLLQTRRTRVSRWARRMELLENTEEQEKAVAAAASTPRSIELTDLRGIGKLNIVQIVTEELQVDLATSIAQNDTVLDALIRCLPRRRMTVEEMELLISVFKGRMREAAQESE